MKSHTQHKNNFRTAKTNLKKFFGDNTIYPKLTINQPNDKFEQQADAMANKVMAMPETGIQRKCSECEKEEKESIQRKPDLQQQEGFSIAR